MDYVNFLERRQRAAGISGFDTCFMPSRLFPFQQSLVEWAVAKGRAAVFADCGLGKSGIELAFAQNVVQHTNRHVLLLTPIAVGNQMAEEAKLVGVEAKVCREGIYHKTPHVVITNYERLHLFDRNKFAGIVCDESSVLKAHSGQTRQFVTEFCKPIPYRLLATATAAPNDYMELGTSAEALGVCRRTEMLATYFIHDSSDTGKWRLKKHAEKLAFWQWICSWARAVRKPSDLGFSNEGYDLPELAMHQHTVGTERDLAVGLAAQRAERKATIEDRIAKVANLCDHDEPSLCFCHLNQEGDMLTEAIRGAVQVSGSDKESVKEEKFKAFIKGQIRVLVTKPRIAGFGLNFQHCAHQTYFPSHSYEELYQSVRRSWRFGQQNPVDIDVVTSYGEANVVANLQRKVDQSAQMFDKMVQLMNSPAVKNPVNLHSNPTELPSWLQ